MAERTPARSVPKLAVQPIPDPSPAQAGRGISPVQRMKNSVASIHDAALSVDNCAELVAVLNMLSLVSVSLDALEVAVAKADAAPKVDEFKRAVEADIAAAKKLKPEID